MRKTIAASLAGLILVSAAAPAFAMPAVGVAPAVMQSSNSDLLQEVRWHGRRGGYDRRYYRHHRHHHHDNNNWGGVAAAGIVGLAAGAIIGSQASRAAPPSTVYYAPQSSDWAAYCASKYRSFDIRTGTYLGYDGYRHPCR